MNDKGWSKQEKIYQELKSPYRSSSVVTGELCFQVCSVICLFVLDRVSFSLCLASVLSACTSKTPSYRQVLLYPAASRFLRILLHYEQSRAAKFWLIVCVGVRSVHLGNMTPEKKRVRPLKPCTGTDDEGRLSPSGGAVFAKAGKGS